MKRFLSIALVSLVYVSAAAASEVQVFHGGKVHTFVWENGKLGGDKVSDAPKFMVHFDGIKEEDQAKVREALKDKIDGFDDKAVSLFVGQKIVGVGLQVVGAVAGKAGEMLRE